jgi:branched-chain amino acid transport system permease protein
VIVGALVLVGLPELMREFAEYRYLFYGMGLVIMMLTRPEGLWPEAARRRELHEAEAEAEVEPATASAVTGK